MADERGAFEVEDSGVIEQAVDPPEPVQRPVDDPPGGLGFCDVPLGGQVVGLLDGADRARVAHDGVPGAAESGYQAGTYALRGAGDDRDLGGGRHPTRYVS